MNAITQNDQIIHNDANVMYFDDVCAEASEMESDEILVVLKNRLPENIGAETQYAAYFFASGETEQTRPLLSSMKSRSIINEHFAERLKAMLDGYTEVKEVDTAYGPAITVASPHANELSADALIPLIEKRRVHPLSFFSVVIDAEPLVDVGDGTERHLVRVVEESMNDEDYEKHDCEMSSDGMMPFAVVTSDTLLALRERYNHGIVGELGFEAWAFNTK